MVRIGSLFSGAGGLDLAVLEVFGGEVVWHAEIDKAASKVLAHRFPGVPNVGDISAVDWADVPAVDVLCGGFPCQDVSAAGKRAGIKAGTRSGLWAVFADAIDELRPQWVVIENVRGLLSATAHRTVDDADSDVEPAAGVMGDGAGRPVLRAAGAVLGDLADLGYDAQWTTVAAASVGAPHRRERVFIVAHSGGAAIGKPAGSAFAEETWQGSGDRSGDSRGERTVADGRQACGCGCRRIDHDWFANPDRFDDGGCRRCRCESFWPASDAPRNGWDEGRPEPARLVRGFDAAVSGDEPGVALLPTPTAQSARHGAESRFGGGNGDVSNLWQIAHLLPTPRNRDGKGATSSRSGDNKHDLPSALAAAPDDDSGEPELSRDHKGRNQRNDETCLTGPLLPTPSAADGERGQDFARANREGSGGDGLVTLTVKADRDSAWGKYEPAIRRWESIVGPAPAPTEPNKNGNPRLSAAFSEWLMGWPQGWVTHPDIGISRNDQLRIIGNGVCPQQASTALQSLLAVATGTHTHTTGRADMTELLPTPTSRDHKGPNQRGDTTCLHGAINSEVTA